MKIALNESEPTGNVEVVVVAMPLPLTVTGVPTLVAPFLNWTVPGTAGETVAVSWIDVP